MENTIECNSTVLDLVSNKENQNSVLDQIPQRSYTLENI